MIHRKIMALVAGSLLGAAFGQADTIKVGPYYGPYQTGQGGEFTITAGSQILDGQYLNYAKTTSGYGYSDGYSFQTFCIEDNEYIYPNSTGTATLSNAAVYGGVGGAVKGSDGTYSDAISLGTAWLYKQFALGTLTGYDYTTFDGRHSSADALQKTIWWLEGELTTVPANSFTEAVKNQFGTLDNAKMDNNGTYGVMVLNLTYDNGAPGQDQLVSVPDGGFTGALLGLSLAGLGFWRRKQI